LRPEAIVCSVKRKPQVRGKFAHRQLLLPSQVTPGGLGWSRIDKDRRSGPDIGFFNDGCMADMDDITRKVLVSTRTFLERLTQAEVLNPDQLTEAHMAVTALGYQLARTAYDPAALDRAHERERALVSELGTILDKRSPAPVNRKWKERWDKGVGAELTTLIADSQAATRTPKTSEGAERDIAQKLRDFLVSYHEPMDPTVSAGTKTTYQGGRGDRQDGEAEKTIYITAPLLQQYLHARFPDMAASTVSEVKRLMGGYSKETYIARLQDEGRERRFVIRKDGYGLPTGSSVSNEFAVLKEVHAAGVPVPEPLWLEADTSHFGAAYMAVSFATGQPAHLHVPADAQPRQKWAEELARTVALLHRTTSKPDLDVRDQIRADIADLQRRVEEREPHPGLAFGLSWLTDHVDDLKSRPACRIHGDIGFHNILMEEDRIVALLDWEFSHYSDPIEDLVYVKPFLDQLEQWPNFLRVYQQECGFGFDEGAARYFGVWKEARNMVACLGSLNSLLLPSVKDVALSVAGTIYIPKYEIAVLDSIINGDSPNV
jgi:aminoglycoside phosphotransferase (APT) family kinase protein